VSWPSPAEVLPHRPPMVLLSRVRAHDPARTVCEVDITPSTLFLGDDKTVPAWVGVEYMAQCVAAHAGLVARGRGEPVRLGLLIGARAIDFHATGFTVGQTIIVTATHTWGERDLASFTCRLADDACEQILADAVMSVYAPPDGVALGRRP
jgi:predicted hotdog family 3-hydroxylacyl-ACP dehydratase